MTASIVERSCTEKHEYHAGAARAVARRMRAETGESLTAYRCPFADDHEDPTKRWHCGHPPSVRSMERLAMEIRRRQGYEMETE